MKSNITRICAAVLALCLLMTACSHGNGDVQNTTSTSAATTTTTDGEGGTTTTSVAATTGSEGVDTTTSVSSASASGTTDTTKRPTTTTTKRPTTIATTTTGPSGTTITEKVLYDKMLGSWIGQMAGVALFASTEFGAHGRVLTQAEMDTVMARWNNGAISINDAFAQDDLYVEIPFMEAMEEHGAFCSVNKMADMFRDSTFPLWHANLAARNNLLAGLEYPDSGHYMYNKHADDIDWQIECDFLGAMYPGMVNAAAQRSFEIGHIMNYGDGVYGGVFVTAMHAAAYTADSVDEVIEAGLAVIPDGTLFKDTMNIVLKSYADGESWETCWKQLEKTVASTDRCPDFCNSSLNIDAKLNAAYILIGLLWGEGDFEKSMVISGRCGQDSDCNPSSTASILGNLYGASQIPEKYKKGLNYDQQKFSTTKYTLIDTLQLHMALAEQVLAGSGAKEKGGVWTLPEEAAYQPVPFEQWVGGDFDAALNVTNLGGGKVKLALTVTGSESLKSVTMDMGDGVVLDNRPTFYTYAKMGEYTITYTVVSTKGSTITHKRRVIVQPVIDKVTPICTVVSPTGGGNKNLNVICDGVVPYITDLNSAIQYDTYDGGQKRDSLYVGLQFDKAYTLKRLEFTEGMHFHDGGWFVGRPQVEVLIDGVWTPIATTLSAPYPTGNTMTDFRNPFETYVFTFEKPISCEGIRLVGKPGGTAYFISVGEFAPVLDV